MVSLALSYAAVIEPAGHHSKTLCRCLGCGLLHSLTAGHAQRPCKTLLHPVSRAPMLFTMLNSSAQQELLAFGSDALPGLQDRT